MAPRAGTSRRHLAQAPHRHLVMTAGTSDLSGTNTAVKWNSGRPRKRTEPLQRPRNSRHISHNTAQLSISTMPLEASIETAAKEAAQEAETSVAQKVKKDTRNAQKRKSYAGLSGEKERSAGTDTQAVEGLCHDETKLHKRSKVRSKICRACMTLSQKEKAKEKDAKRKRKERAKKWKHKEAGAKNVAHQKKVCATEI